MDENLEIKKKEAWRVGIGVLILLAALTVGEYWLGSFASAWWAPLLGVALLKAFLVVRDYMHLQRLFAPDEESH
jgi:hypothetical protein